MSEKLVFDKKIRGSYIICILPLCNYEVDLLALFRIADAQQTEWYDIIERLQQLLFTTAGRK